MKKLKTIIVEENKENRDQLSLLLREHCHDVEVSALVSTIEEAVQSIEDHSPELLFLDVELLGKNDPDILKLYKQLPFKVLFFKGYLKYAYLSTKLDAADLLFKPVKINDLTDAIKRIDETKHYNNFYVKLETKNKQFEDPPRLIMHEVSGFTVIETDKIIKLEANGHYTNFYLTGDRKHTYCRILKEFEELLEIHPNFLRVHKSFLINLDYVISYSSQGEIKLIENQSALLGDSYRNRFLTYFS